MIRLIGFLHSRVTNLNMLGAVVDAIYKMGFWCALSDLGGMLNLWVLLHLFRVEKVEMQRLQQQQTRVWTTED